MALAVEVLLAAAVLLAAGLAAAGRIDGMSRAVPDRPPGLPDGEVTPDGLRDVTLPVVVRGYRMADVDDILERAARELEHARVVAQQRAEEPGVEPSGSSAVIDG
jgi:DivIVA domain-containing protein